MIGKKLKKMLISLVVIVTGLMLVACSSRDSLVGTWTVGDNRIIFLENGTGEQVNSSRGFTNEFRWTEGARIPFALSEVLGVELYEYEIDGDTLILRRPGSSHTAFYLRRE